LIRRESRGAATDESRDIARSINVLKKAFLMAAVAAGVVSVAPSADAANHYWTPWVSEEGGEPWSVCLFWNEGATGFGCRGAYCDDVRLLCETLPGGMTLDPASKFVPRWFSEEGALPPGQGSTWTTANQSQCRMFVEGTIDSWTRGIVSGVHCRGDYCDQLQVECEAPVKMDGPVPVPARGGSCRTFGPYSEENGSMDFGAGRYIYGITCSGDYCDNKKFEVCTFTAPF
jgi:hypothetical protein